MVTPDMRRNAKAVNFGIVYGQTPFGLAQGLGIDRKEAKPTSTPILNVTPACRKFIDRTIAEVRKTGVSLTLLRPQPSHPRHE